MADDTAWYSSSPCSAVPRGGLIDPPHETDTGRECRTQRDTASQKRAESRIRPRMRHQLSGTDRKTNAVPDPCRPVSRRTDAANPLASQSEETRVGQEGVRQIKTRRA